MGRIFMTIYFLLLVGVRFRYSPHAYGAFNQLSTMPPLEKILMVFVLMSLGGLPPLLGFLGKLIVLKNILYFMDFKDQEEDFFSKNSSSFPEGSTVDDAPTLQKP